MCVFSLLSELICGFLFSPRQGWQCGVRCEWVLHLYFALSFIFLSLFCLCLKVPGLVAADENVCSPFFFITDGWKFIDCLTSLVFPVCVSAEGLCFSVLFISFYSSIFQTLWLSRYQSFSFDFHCTSATILISVSFYCQIVSFTFCVFDLPRCCVMSVTVPMSALPVTLQIVWIMTVVSQEQRQE